MKRYECMYVEMGEQYGGYDAFFRDLSYFGERGWRLCGFNYGGAFFQRDSNWELEANARKARDGAFLKPEATK